MVPGPLSFPPPEPPLLDPKTKQIAGYTFTVTPLPGWQGLELLQQLGKLIGPAIAKLGQSAAQANTGNDAAALAGVSGAIEGALTALKPGELVMLGKQLLANTLVQTPAMGPGDAVPVLKVFDSEFAGQIFTVLKLMTFAIEVNYADFFAALRPALAVLGARLKALTARELISPPTSPSSGPAGDSSQPAS